MKKLIDTLRAHRACHLAVTNLRILLGFAFVPAGLKKILYQPFTDPQNTGTFHEFLHAFYATGVFYQFVGIVQLVLAVLLMTQTFATLGALATLPVITTIMVFCWSTQVIPTAVVTTLMFLGTLALVAWDVDRLLPILHPGWGSPSLEKSQEEHPPLIDLSLWRRCGAGILIFYGLTCILYGGVYRPKGVDLGNPAFYVMPLIALFPLVTFFIEQRRRANTRKYS